MEAIFIFQFDFDCQEWVAARCLSEAISIMKDIMGIDSDEMANVEVKLLSNSDMEKLKFYRDDSRIEFVSFEQRLKELFATRTVFPCHFASSEV